MIFPKNSGPRMIATAAVMLVADVSGYGLEPKDLLSVQAGPLTIRPRLTVAEQYDDNLFYQPSENATGDFVTMVTPGFDLVLGRPDNPRFADLKYDFTEVFYASNPFINNAMDHNVRLSASDHGNKLSLDLTGSFDWANTIYGGLVGFTEGYIGTNIVFLPSANIERITYDVNPSVSYAFGEKLSAYTRFDLTGNSFLEAFVERPFFDLNTWTATVGSEYAIRPKLGLFGEINYGQQAGDPNSPPDLPPELQPHKPPHLDNFGGYLGIRGQITPKLNGRIQVGYQDSAYAGGGGDINFLTVKATVTAQFSEKTSASLSYSREGSASVQFAGLFYVSDLVGLQLNQTLGTFRPWMLNVGCSYGRNEYQNAAYAGETSQYFSVTTGISYQIKLWLRTGLSYQFQKTGSSINSAIDYDVNQVTLNIAIGF